MNLPGHSAREASEIDAMASSHVGNDEPPRALVCNEICAKLLGMGVDAVCQC